MITNTKTPRTYRSGSLKFIVIAVALMLVVKLVVVKSWNERHLDSDTQSVEYIAPEEAGSVPDLGALGVPVSPAVVPNDTLSPLPAEAPVDPKEVDPADVDATDSDATPSPVPADERSSAKDNANAKKHAKTDEANPPTKSISNKRTLVNGERPKIVIMIDDMGVSVQNSRDVMALSGPLTLAFLPYAKNLPDMTADARAKGHELMIHVPMEAMNGDMDLGAVALKANMSGADMNTELTEKVFTAFEGYKGINNHMGSRLTQDSAAMKLVMKHLKQRGLYFVDSRTINSSVAAHMAAEAGIKHATRDVFLDHYTDIESVTKALGRLERVAAKNGVAIGIGHPKPNTVKALKRWLPTLKAKGFDVVPASAVVRRTPSTTVAATSPKPAPVVAPKTVSKAPSKAPSKAASKVLPKPAPSAVKAEAVIALETLPETEITPAAGDNDVGEGVVKVIPKIDDDYEPFLSRSLLEYSMPSADAE